MFLDEKIIQQVCAIAKQAGEVILTFDRAKPGHIDQQEKVDGSPVTAADFAANKVIEQGIKALPIEAYPIISEEDPRSVNSVVSDFEYCWLVDPLDGTKGYVRGWDDFTVNIALVENGCPVFGVIVHPVNQDCFWALVDHGAYQIDQQGQRTQLKIPRSTRPPWRILTGCFQNQTLWMDYLKPLGPLTWQAQNSSIKFCTLSQGLADLYPRGANISAWDTAAGQIILEEAGGALVDFNGARLCYTGSAKSQKGREDAGFLAFADKDHVGPWLTLLKESSQ